MSGPKSVAAYCRGLIELLQQSSDGSTPNESAGFIQPTVDIERYIGNNFRTVQAIAVVGAVLGNNGIVTVPDGQYWILRGASLTVSHAAGANNATDVAAVMFPGTNASQGVLIIEPFDAVSAAAENKGRCLSPSFAGLIVTPGSVFRIAFAGTLAGAVNADLRLLVDVLS